MKILIVFLLLDDPGPDGDAPLGIGRSLFILFWIAIIWWMFFTPSEKEKQEHAERIKKKREQEDQDYFEYVQWREEHIDAQIEQGCPGVYEPTFEEFLDYKYNK